MGCLTNPMNFPKKDLKSNEFENLVNQEIEIF